MDEATWRDQFGVEVPIAKLPWPVILAASVEEPLRRVEKTRDPKPVLKF